MKGRNRRITRNVEDYEGIWRNMEEYNVYKEGHTLTQSDEGIQSNTRKRRNMRVYKEYKEYKGYKADKECKPNKEYGMHVKEYEGMGRNPMNARNTRNMQEYKEYNV